MIKQSHNVRKVDLASIFFLSLWDTDGHLSQPTLSSYVCAHVNDVGSLRDPGEGGPGTL